MPRQASTPASFWSKVDRSGDCWEWTGCCFAGKEYGVFRCRGKNLRAHRYAYEITYGPIPAGLFVCHRCDNPRCVRPDHLFLGTAAHNSADMVAKRRQARGKRTRPETRARGERHHKAKITAADVRDIRRLYAEGVSQRTLADRYALAHSNVFAIVTRRSWRHVD